MAVYVVELVLTGADCAGTGDVISVPPDLYYEHTAVEIPETGHTKNIADTNRVTSVTKVTKNVKQVHTFNFPASVLPDAQLYLTEVYDQAYAACQDTAYPDPFIATALSIIERSAAL